MAIIAIEKSNQCSNFISARNKFAMKLALDKFYENANKDRNLRTFEQNLSNLNYNTTLTEGAIKFIMV